MLNNAIKKLNESRNVNFVQISEDVYEGIVSIENDTAIRMWFDFSTGFPNRFPSVILPDHSGFRPHVSSDGKVCLFDEDSIMVRADMPDQLVIDSFDRALEILRMDLKTQSFETYREFQVYWASKSKSKYAIHLNLPVSDEHELKEYTAVCSDYRRMVIVSSTVEESENILFRNVSHDASKDQEFHIPCTRIRLRESALPSLNTELTWKSYKDFILKHITGGQRRRFKEFLSIKPKHLKRLILVQIPSLYGDQYAAALLTCNNTNHTSLNNSQCCKVDPVITYRIDQHYLLQRSGAETDLTDKSVLLIGCGSVGGFIAENLCQCGVGTLDILDDDILAYDNIHRHILGFDAAICGGYKADLMKKHLEGKYPYAEIDSLNFQDRTAESFFTDIERLLCYDLIVSATGNPATNLMINEKIKENGIDIPFVVCFNEPYGIGGHTIVITSKGACLRCLYSDTISGELTHFQGSFVQDGQTFAKSLSGCAGTFVEYSVLDSQQTAILATRLIIEVLKGKCLNSRMVSWLGDSTKLKQNGFHTSEYFEELQTHGFSIISKEIQNVQRCRLCGK